MNESQMEKCLQHIGQTARLVYSKESFWKVTEMTLMAPATKKEISQLSKESPFPLPPSYVQFLSMSDGCLNFWPKFALLGTKGEPRGIVQAEIEDAREHQSQFAADANGDLTSESVAKFEIPKEDTLTQYFFLPNHLVFGADKAGEFFLFNEGKQAGKEYEVIHYTYSGGAYYRYADFPSFLTATAQQLEDRIKKKGYAAK